MTKIEPPSGLPLGFPKCGKCTYLRSGPSALCLTCASATFEDIGTDSCPVCDQFLDGGVCPNWLCTDPDRRITRIRAIAYLSGPLRSTILRYKYDNKRGWALIFGRLLLAWLDRHTINAPPNLIVANPTFVGRDGATFGHTEKVIDAAVNEDVLGEWAFDDGEPRVITKVRPTMKSARNTAPAKRAAAIELGAALRLNDRSQTVGKRILIYDDVCTTGSQLDAVAGFLIDEGGAADVEGVVLARAPWRKR